MTFAELCRYVQERVDPENYVSVQVELSRYTTGNTELHYSVYVSEGDEAGEHVYANTIDGVRAAFDSRWGTPQLESELVLINEPRI